MNTKLPGFCSHHPSTKHLFWLNFGYVLIEDQEQEFYCAFLEMPNLAFSEVRNGAQTPMSFFLTCMSKMYLDTTPPMNIRIPGNLISPLMNYRFTAHFLWGVSGRADQLRSTTRNGSEFGCTWEPPEELQNWWCLGPKPSDFDNFRNPKSLETWNHRHWEHLKSEWTLKYPCGQILLILGGPSAGTTTPFVLKNAEI